MAKLALDSLPHKVSFLSLQHRALLKINIFFSSCLLKYKGAILGLPRAAPPILLDHRGEGHLVSLNIGVFGQARIEPLALLSTTWTWNDTLCTWQLQKIAV